MIYLSNDPYFGCSFQVLCIACERLFPIRAINPPASPTVHLSTHVRYDSEFLPSQKFTVDGFAYNLMIAEIYDINMT